MLCPLQITGVPTAFVCYRVCAMTPLWPCHFLRCLRGLLSRACVLCRAQPAPRTRTSIGWVACSPRLRLPNPLHLFQAGVAFTGEQSRGRVRQSKRKHPLPIETMQCIKIMIQCLRRSKKFLKKLMSRK